MDEATLANNAFARTCGATKLGSPRSFAALEAPTDRAIQTIGALQATVPNTRLIVYTDVTDMGVTRQLVQMGVADILSRPLSEADLANALNRGRPRKAKRKMNRLAM